MLQKGAPEATALGGGGDRDGQEVGHNLPLFRWVAAQHGEAHRAEVVLRDVREHASITQPGRQNGSVVTETGEDFYAHAADELLIFKTATSDARGFGLFTAECARRRWPHG